MILPIFMPTGRTNYALMRSELSIVNLRSRILQGLQKTNSSVAMKLQARRTLR